MATDADLVRDIETLGAGLGAARDSIARRFIGQERVVELTLSALICGGHALLVGLPGLGKGNINAAQILGHRHKLLRPATIAESKRSRLSQGTHIGIYILQRAMICVAHR